MEAFKANFIPNDIFLSAFGNFMVSVRAVYVRRHIAKSEPGRYSCQGEEEETPADGLKPSFARNTRRLMRETTMHVVMLHEAQVVTGANGSGKVSLPSAYNRKLQRLCYNLLTLPILP